MLVAKKSFPYKGRVMRPGDAFEPRSRQDARVLIALNRAEKLEQPKPVEKPKKASKAKLKKSEQPAPSEQVTDPDSNPPSGVAPAEAVPDVTESEVSAADLRTVAESLGVSVDKRWSKKRLQEEIDKARNTYSTRMMSAE